jgi:hypothetical protein
MINGMNYAAYFTIEKSLGGRYFADRSEAVSMFTNGRKNSLKDLSEKEYWTFIGWLNRTFNSTPCPSKGGAGVAEGAGDGKDGQSSVSTDILNHQRRKIIALLCKIGYLTADGKADMPRIYQWVKSHGYLHKPLNAYTAKELPRLVTQAELFYKSHIERL